MKSVCILGATGIFGHLITQSLMHENIPVVPCGRNKSNTRVVSFDIHTELEKNLNIINPAIVINTCGPFQGQSYSVAKTCINLGIHYIDLADGRDYVSNFSELDKLAKEKHVLAVTGASTVPGLSSAVIEQFKSEFKSIESLDYGITPGAKSPRGIATVKAILSYLGKPFIVNGKKMYGWQNLHRVKYPELGYRWMGSCDIPDLDLFPEKYNIKNIAFSAGMESTGLHLSIWLLSWLVRLGLPINVAHHANLLTKASHIFDVGGSENGGMHMILKGIDHNNKPLTLKWFVVVKNNEGPNVPTIPSIILAKKILSGQLQEVGTKICMGMISLAEYQEALSQYTTTYHIVRE